MHRIALRYWARISAAGFVGFYTLVNGYAVDVANPGFKLPRLSITACDDSTPATRKVQLKQPKDLIKTADIAMLWRYELFWDRVRDRAFENLRVIEAEMTNNRHLYPANDVANPGRKIAVGPASFSLKYSSTNVLTQIQKQNKRFYDDIVAPFSELSAKEMSQLVRTGSMTISVEEPWNQNKADDIVVKLDSFGNRLCATIMIEMINHGAKSLKISKEIHVAARKLKFY